MVAVQGDSREKEVREHGVVGSSANTSEFEQISRVGSEVSGGEKDNL